MWQNIGFSYVCQKYHKFYRFNALNSEAVENMTFGEIRGAVVTKFCDEDCDHFYKEHFLGCCSASMIKDTGKKHVLPFLKSVHYQSIESIYFTQVVEAYLVNRFISCANVPYLARKVTS